MKKIYVYPTEDNIYLKVSYIREKRANNIGCLQHIISPGTLNVKKELKEIIDASSRSPLKYMPFTPSNDPTRSHGGVGFVGYYTCNDLPQSIDLLNAAIADSGYILEL